MPRVMLVVLGLGVLVWALAFVDFGRPRAHGGAAARDEPSVEASDPAPPLAARAPARPSSTTARPTASPIDPGSVPAATAEPYIALRPSPMRAETSAGRKLAARQPPPRGALSTVTGELGEGIMSPEYAEMERSYAREPRDGTWAEGQEQRLRGLLQSSPLASSVGLVNCQESMCRVLLESDDYDAYSRLLAIPGFSALTGLGPGSAYSHRSGQLSVYFSPPRSDQPAR